MPPVEPWGQDSLLRSVKFLGPGSPVFIIFTTAVGRVATAMKLKMVMWGIHSDDGISRSTIPSSLHGLCGQLRNDGKTPNHDAYILSQAYTFVGEALNHTRSKGEWSVARCSHTRVTAIYSPGQEGLQFLLKS